MAEGEHDETKVVAHIGFMELVVRPGNLMPQKIHDAFQEAQRIAEDWAAHKDGETFNWGFGDFTGGELQYDDVTAQKLDTIPTGETLLRFTMFPSAGRALAIRPNGELVEFEITFVAKKQQQHQ